MNANTVWTTLGAWGCLYWAIHWAYTWPIGLVIMLLALVVGLLGVLVLQHAERQSMQGED